MAFVQNFPFFSIMAAILCGILCLTLPRQAVRLTVLSLSGVALLSLAVCIHTVSTGVSYVYVMGHFVAPFGNELRAGPLETTLSVGFASVLLLSFMGGLRDLRRDVPGEKLPIFCVMCNMIMAGMLAMIYTNDLFTAFIFIDIITIAACSVVAAKPGGRTLVATMTYLIMSLLGSGLFFLSIALLYNVTGHLLMPGLQQSITLLAASGQYRLPLLMAAGLMTVGLALKSALFPFHIWLPDAHADATTAASSILSGLVIKCYLVLLIKVYCRIYTLPVIAGFRICDMLLVFGLAGLIWGSWQASRQTHIKRMLSFASVSQVGFLCVCIGLGTPAGMAVACFHLLGHAAAKAMLFCSAGALSHVSGHRKLLTDLRGSGRIDRLAGAAFVVGNLSMIGVPPLSAFFSKLYLSLSAFGSPAGAAVVLIVVVVGTLLSTLYYVPAMACVMGRPPEAAPPPAPRPAYLTAALWGFLALNIGLGLFAQPIFTVLQQGLQVFG